MSQKLLVDGFEWMESTDFTEELVKNHKVNSAVG